MRPDIQTALAEFNKDTPDWYMWIDISAGEVFSNVKVIKEGAVLPSEEDFNAKLAELQAAYDNDQYKRDRASAYPPITEQLDQIYHEGIDAWKADIKAIKDKYPKPAE